MELSAPFAEVSMVFRLCVGGLLTAVGVSKVRDLGSFRRAVHAYRVLPISTVGTAAPIIAGLEILAGLALVAGLLPIGTILGLALLGTFSLAISWNIARGRKIPCGCAMGGDEPISGTQLVRNLLLIIMLSALLILPTHPWSVEAALNDHPVSSATWADGIVAVLMVPALWLAWSLSVKVRALIAQMGVYRDAALSLDDGHGGEVN